MFPLTHLDEENGISPVPNKSNKCTPGDRRKARINDEEALRQQYQR
jgi:hypothetical protein